MLFRVKKEAKCFILFYVNEMVKRARLLSLLLFLAVGGFFPTAAGAQGMQQVFDQFMQEIDEVFYSYLDSLDLVFADYLEQEWEEFEVQEAVYPVSYATGYVKAQTEVPYCQSYADPSSTLFYGHRVEVPLVTLPHTRPLKTTEKEIASFWRALYTTDFTPFYAGCMRQVKEMQLNDWGEFLLLHHLVSLYEVKMLPDERTLFTFYLLTHAGIKAKVCMTSDKKMLLLVSFAENIYGYPFIQIEDEKYYVWTPAPTSVKKVFSFTENYPGIIRPLSLLFTQPLRFAVTPVQPHIEDTRSLLATIPINKNLLDFYQTMPLCDLQVYHHLTPSLAFQEEMNKRLLPLLKNKSPYERIELLLELTQQTTRHKKDEEVHGREVYYSPEEFVFYPYADCEDFCLFLYWLIKNYTRADVLFLYYPQHIALAVEKMEGYKGATFQYEDKAYFICDPSYIGSKPGTVVPAYKLIDPIVQAPVKKR
ncbi:hypothetical protein M2480_001017 [Parabacteroides sp. PFB2-12]|nr:hypothetical protein [Parabacteroides sp. PM6-13]MDH6390047.1 hypothetical protein [Parabacteroides sp. PFB2-12]